MTVDTKYIATQNLKVIGQILTGIGTAGVSSSIVMLWNGYRLGYGLSAVARRAPQHLAKMLFYVPLEFSAFMAATIGTHYLLWRLMQYVLGVDVKLGLALLRAGMAVSLALALLLLSAVVESWVKNI